MKIKLLLLFIAAFSLASCKKDKNEKNLEGRWNLSKTYSLISFNGTKQSEETQNHQVGEFYIVFEGSKASTYRNGSLLDAGTFTADETSLTLVDESGEKETVALRWNGNDELTIGLEETETIQGLSYQYKIEQTYHRH